MLFNSSQYLVFLPLVVFGYYLLPHRLRWVLLLAASYYFYMCWRMEYVLLIAGTTLIDYGMGIAIFKSPTQTRKRIFLITSLVINLGLLFLFKYFDFFSESFRLALQAFNITVAAPELNLLLPVGISFYTFQSVAYIVEVYRGHVPAERHLGRFAAYISFFPQLVAGPIERPTKFLPQFREWHKPNYERMTTALNLIALGFFKKVVVADRCAMYVNEVFGSPAQFGAWATAMGIFLFAIQIYCDFSGYSDIAVGSARLMGFDLMQNFDRPYLSRSISEFWRKWHISLSTWFRDYFYLPLGGSRRSPWRNHLNVFLTFLVSGLWHGANLTFLVWGAFHGALLVADRILRPNAAKAATGPDALNYPSTPDATNTLPASDLSESPPASGGTNPLSTQDAAKSSTAGRASPASLRYWPQIALTFALVCIGWVFFRAENLDTAGQIFSNLLDFSQAPSSVIIRAGNNPLGILNFGLLCLSLGLFCLSGFLPRNLHLRYNLLFLIFMSLIVLFLGRNAGNEFIYFQF